LPEPRRGEVEAVLAQGCEVRRGLDEPLDRAGKPQAPFRARVFMRGKSIAG
jgi:hypothetical protein